MIKSAFLAIALFPAGVILALAGSSLVPFGGGIVTHGDSSDRVVALTFDDGPGFPGTPAILDTLGRYHVPGTFFLVGENVKRNPELALRIVREGHQIGLHSNRHSLALPYETPRQIRADTSRNQQVISDAAGVSPLFYRPPHGRTTPWMRREVRKRGLVLVNWDVSPGDWRRDDPDAISSRVLDRVSPGSIVLLHDGLDTSARPDHTATVDALGKIIIGLQSRGYRFVTLAELLGKGAYEK